MGRCLIQTLEWKCYFRPPAIMGFSASTLLLLLLFYFWQRDRGERLSLPSRALQAPLRHPQAGGQGGAGVPAHLCLSVWPTGSLMEEPQPQVHGKEYTLPTGGQSAAPPRASRGSDCISEGPSAFLGRAFVLVLFGLEDYKADQVLRTDPESQKQNHWSLPPVEAMMTVFYREQRIPNGVSVALPKGLQQSPIKDALRCEMWGFQLYF